MSRLLYGVQPLDPITYLGVLVVMIATSIAALTVPARRVLRVDPLAALREE